jgi:hypothetical protein
MKEHIEVRIREKYLIVNEFLNFIIGLLMGREPFKLDLASHEANH